MLVLACKSEEAGMIHTGCVAFLAWVIKLDLNLRLAACSVMTRDLMNCLWEIFLNWRREAVLLFIFQFASKR